MATSKERWGTVGRHATTAVVAAGLALFARGEALGRDLQRLDTVEKATEETKDRVRDDHDVLLEIRGNVAVLVRESAKDAELRTAIRQLLDELERMREGKR